MLSARPGDAGAPQKTIIESLNGETQMFVAYGREKEVLNSDDQG